MKGKPSLSTKTSTRPVPFVILRRRADFLRAARAKRFVTSGFILQVRPRDDCEPSIRVGFTCSKKLGNAVTRNRAKRRLRSVARDVFPAQGQLGTDYVLIGRRGSTIQVPYDLLIKDLSNALAKSS